MRKLLLFLMLACLLPYLGAAQVTTVDKYDGKTIAKEIVSKSMKEIIPDTYGPAPAGTFTAQNVQGVKSETSDALIAIGGYDLFLFTLNDPSNPNAFGTSISEFANCAEYFAGMYYYATSTSGQFGTVDPATGAVTVISSGNPYGGIAYNPADGQMYGLSLGSSATLYTVDISSGASTAVVTCSAANFLLGMTITNDGHFLVIDAEIDGISELDPATGALTTVCAAGFTVNYGQDLACDRETNTPYWAAYNADGGGPQLYSVNYAGGAITLIGSFSSQASCFAIQTEANPELAAAPTNFTAVPQGTDLVCNLSWTNPSTTIGGTALSSINTIVLKRNGTIIQEFTSPTVGGAMTFSDNTITSPGSYSYSVYAVTSQGNGAAAGASAVVGPMCEVTVEMWDSFGDGWNGAAINFVNPAGITEGSASLSSGTSGSVTLIMSSGVLLNCVWVAGSWDNECSFLITDFSGATIYDATSGAPAAGTFHTFTNNCSLDVPAAVTNFSAVADPNNELSATISWTNPTTTLGGATLTSLISATVMRNGTVVYTATAPAVGGNLSFVDNTITSAGMYNYAVYVTNDNGNGPAVAATIGVGGIYQMEFGQTVEITTCSGLIYDNGGASGQYQNNSNDIMIIYPSSENASIAITGTYVIEGGWDYLYVYDGAGTSGTLLSTYSNSNGGTIENVSPSGPLTLYFTSDGSVPKDGFEIAVSCVAQTTVTGTITSLATGAGIEGATVSFAGLGAASATTDASGNYSLSILTGTFTASAAANGYNTYTEANFVITENGAVFNAALTNPVIAVAPSAVDVTTYWGIDGHATVTLTNTGNGPANFSFSPEYLDKGGDGKEAWDLVNTFTATAGGMQGVVTDGQYIYLTSWQASPSAGYSFEKYDLDLNFVEGFNISGVSQLRDMTYDGTYFYSGSGSTLYCLDLANKTLVSSVSTGVGTIRHCTYDPDQDCFWVGNWTDLYLIDRTGSVLLTGPGPDSAYGSGYDNVTAGGPYLLLFCQPNSDAQVYRYVIETNTLESSSFFDFSSTPGFNAGISGGAYVGEYDGLICFFGNLQQDPNLIGIYELGTAGWLSADPSSGVVAAGESVDVLFTMDGYYDYFGTWHANANFATNPATTPVPTVAVTFTIAEPACPAPTGLTATVNLFNNIDLAWNAPAGFGKGRNVVLEETFETGAIPDGWTILDEDGDGYFWDAEYGNGLFTGHTGECISSASYINYVGALTPDNWLITPQITINGGTVNYWINSQDASYANEHYGVYISTSGTDPDDFELLFEETMTAKGEKYAGERGSRDQGAWYERTIELDGYSGDVYLAFRHFNCTDAFWLNLDDVVVDTEDSYSANLVGYRLYYVGAGTHFAEVGANVTSYTDSGLEPGEYCYMVRAVFDDDCISLPSDDACAVATLPYGTISGTVTDALSMGPIEGATVKFDNDNIATTDANGEYSIYLVAKYYEQVRVAATGFISQYLDINVEIGSAVYDFELYNMVCDPVTDLAATVEENNVTLTWVGGTIITPPGGVVLEEHFESGAVPAGWTNLDEDGDGYLWDAETGNGIFTGHTGECISSASYINYVGALTPDNWLITPQMAISGGNVNYWVNAQDAAYAYEHYGVYISTSGTDPDDFVLLFEETMTAKGEKYAGERGSRDQGTWYERTVNLDGYNGNVYLAFRHFNCTDAFWLNLDDVIVTSGGGKAAKENVLSEAFESGAIPAGWTNLDEDGDGYLWDAETGLGLFVGHTGECISSASYINYVGALTPDNWLITPEIEIGSTSTLTYWVNAQDAAYAYEHYGVYISTTGTDPNDFELLFEETMTAKGEKYAGERGSREQGTWYERTIDLTGYSGIVYIAFRHFNCTDAFWLNLDDVNVESDGGSGGNEPGNLVGYRVYRDGNYMGTVTEETFYDPFVQFGTHVYCVRALYENCVSDYVCVDVDITLDCQEVANFFAIAHDNEEEVYVECIWTAPGAKDHFLGYDIYRDGTKITNNLISDLYYNDYDVEIGDEYCYAVAAVYDECTVLSDWVCVALNGEYSCAAPTDLTVAQIAGTDDVLLEWVEPEGNLTHLLGYNVYRGEVMIAYLLLETNYQDINVPAGSYSYDVTAVYDYNCESDPISGSITTVGIENGNSTSIRIYPNPSNNYVNVVGENIQTIAIYNSLGQIITVLNYTSGQVDVSNFNSGVYIFNITTSNGQVFKERVVVNK